MEATAISSLLDALLIAKISVSIAAVVGLSLIAEHVSPRVAGILAGYPLGTAIALFFIGLENGATFAATGARHTLLGFAASLALVYAYYHGAKRSGRWALPVGALAGVAAFLSMAQLLSQWTLGLVASVLLPAAAVVLVCYLFRGIPDTVIQQRVRFTHSVLAIRAGISAAIVVLITGLAASIGPGWAGLLSAFPITLFPFLLIIHLAYGPSPVYTIIRNYPLGLGSLIVYALSVSLVYEPLGVAWGTLVSFGFATLYLLGFSALLSRRRSRTA